MEFIWKTKEFKKMNCPSIGKRITKYVFYAKVSDIKKSDSLLEWMKTNPREQNLKTNVAKTIKSTLNNKDETQFHNLNRGILFSAETVTYNNKTNEVVLTFENNQIHGNIDGGHTLKTLIEESDEFGEEKYVFIEIITNLNRVEVIQLAEARNTSIQVDTLSIEELNETFKPFKNIFAGEEFLDRVKFKQNQIKGKINTTIDGRELIALLNMFNIEITKADRMIQPVNTYSAKESALKGFLKWKEKEPNFKSKIESKKELFNDVIKLFETIELELPQMVNNTSKRRYGALPFAGESNQTSTTFLNQVKEYSVPKGLVYPMINCFRVLIDKRGESWKEDPFKFWKKNGKELSLQLIEELKQQSNNPNSIGKSSSVWKALYNTATLQLMDDQ